MGCIVTSVPTASFENLDKEVTVRALVDTGAMYLTLPPQWRGRFGEFGDLREQTCVLASGSGHFEPLLGCIPLEQSQVAVDTLGHRLFKVDAIDLKGFQLTPSERSLLALRSEQMKDKASP